MVNDTLGVYIHVPFCKSKCPYCDFYSVTDISLIDSYVNSICSQINYWGKKTKKDVDTIYFGGGTPSLIGTEKILKILSFIKNNFNVKKTAEITLEVNPGDCFFIDFEKLKSEGVNRISLGAQSLNDSQLKILGRRHGVEDIIKSVDIIKSAKIENISLDLILGAPEQTDEDIKTFADFCKDSKIPHVSAYILKVEKGTPYYFNKEKLNFYSDDNLADIYLYACKLLSESGYNHYEISNFAKSGFESKHNLKYWKLNEYLGIGPAAHSLIDGKRFYYEKDLKKFISDPKVKKEENFEAEKEFVMLALRTKWGIKNGEYKAFFGKDIPKKYFKKTKKFESFGLVTTAEDEIKLTEKGFLLSNYIISEIM